VFPPGPNFASPAVGVGSSEEQAGSPVRGAGIGRAYNSPFDIEPDGGKVGEDSVKPKSKVCCDVLTDELSGS